MNFLTGGRRRTLLVILAAPSLVCAAAPATSAGSQDQFTELVERRGSAALAWVAEQNRQTTAALKDTPLFRMLRAHARFVADDSARRPKFANGWAYKFILSSEHPHGIWARTTIVQFFAGRPQWQTLLDMDDLRRREATGWDFLQADCDKSNCLILLSDGAGRKISREFNLASGQFVSRGFSVEVDSSPQWVDADTIVYARRVSGLPLGHPQPFELVALKRGQRPLEARVLGRTGPETRSFGARFLTDSDGSSRMLGIEERAGSRQLYYWFGRGDGTDFREAPWVPQHSQALISRGFLVLTLAEDWRISNRTFASGSVVEIALSSIDAGTPRPKLLLRLRPDEVVKSGISLMVARNLLIVDGFKNVRGRCWSVDPSRPTYRTTLRLPDFRTFTLLHIDESGRILFVRADGFLGPPEIFKIDLYRNLAVPVSVPRSTRPTSMIVRQYFARSADGVSIPYFLIGPKGDRAVPTIIQAYGAYGEVLSPHYDSAASQFWLSRGGAIIVPALRGDGAYAGWHVVGAERVHTYQDLYAVAKDALRRGLTTPHQLGLYGFSAGGAVVGNAINAHPQLFNAAVMANAYLDLLRPDLTQHGESGISAEWGSLEEPVQRAFLARTSPRENLRPSSGAFPPLVLTSTDDSRVFPAQSRLYAATLSALGRNYYFFEHPLGDHGKGDTPQAILDTEALTYAYFIERLFPHAADSSNGQEANSR